ncbi:MAG: orotate phosphoribosyltransferase [Syntrophomonadaceae bacterium]|nr:orotate phosphoribosyltransferase [Syntrophomonadaceae bacterium]
MLSREAIEKMFVDAGALLEGHFLLTSGRHSNRYMQCAQVLQYPAYTEALSRILADRFRNDGVDVVVGPAMGGIIVAYEVARQLGVRGIFCERENGVMTLRRGFSIQPGERILVVEDVITTGGSVMEVMEVTKARGGEVVGVAVLVDRSGGKVDLGLRTEAALVMEIDSWEADSCPLCREGTLPITKPGSRK